jgi:dienelactone hydrolase
MRAILLTLAISILLEASSFAATDSADQYLADYFRHETDAITQRCLADVRTLQDWNARRGEYRRQLFEMLSLDPLPDRTDLRPQVTGRVEHDSFTVENLHFQSMPGLYVTGNMYLPKDLKQRAPAVLYVCGHGPVITNGISYGNKVTYQHHGAWFARNGYVCLLIDTLQLGEIQGLHHGTHREGMWWWNSRGYTPAGVEAWNSVRSLDYLSTRPEVDTNRFGVTGRSGGGAYSWWLAALDDRIKAAAPVAGITDLHNHVVDGVVEGHCDCMFTVNTYRWDYPQVASLVAPRPLLIVNTDSDSIFPLDGVARTHEKVRALYRLHNAATNLGLVIGPGPHKDTQDLQVPVFRWFNRHLKGEDPPIEMAATKLFTPQQLKVFNALPADAINTNIQKTFVPIANHAAIPENESLWRQQREIWMSELRQKVFAGWPQERGSIAANTRSSATHGGVKLEVIEFFSRPHQVIRLYRLSGESSNAPQRIVLRAFGSDETGPTFDDWVYSVKDRFAAELSEELEAAGRRVVAEHALLNFSAITNTVFVIVAPRGIGAGAWSGDTRKQRHIRRRFMLLGQTLDAMRVWDIRQAIRLTRERWSNIPLTVEGAGNMAVNTLYAGLFENGVDQLNLWNPPASHMEGPDYLNVLRVTDLPQTVAMTADRCSVRLETSAPENWDYARHVAARLSWSKSKLEIVKAQP